MAIGFDSLGLGVAVALMAGGVASGELFADAAAGDTTSKLMGAGVMIASLGLATWYVWFDTVKVKPRQAREQREMMEAMQARHATDMHNLITNFREDQRGMWALKKEGDMAIVAAMKEMRDAIASRNECDLEREAEHHRKRLERD